MEMVHAPVVKIKNGMFFWNVSHDFCVEYDINNNLIVSFNCPALTWDHIIRSTTLKNTIALKICQSLAKNSYVREGKEIRAK